MTEPFYDRKIIRYVLFTDLFLFLLSGINAKMYITKNAFEEECNGKTRDLL